MAAPRSDLHHTWGLPEIGSVEYLAEILELDLGQLRWLADLHGCERRAGSEALRNYRYRIVPRRGGLGRVLEIPKGRSKEIQRWILAEILDRVPPHEAACGFRPGGSVVEHARRHTGAAMVLSLDLQDFFPSVGRSRVRAIFTALGYGREVAAMLSGLCTNVVPLSVWAQLESAGVSGGERAQGRRFALERRLASPHLPQGAPSSPALANLAARGLDRRLDGLARSRGLSYSRYADDLTLSGDRRTARSRQYLVALLEEIVRDEGFTLHHAKTAVHLAGGRQQICGIVVNAHPNLPRAEIDRLAATLHNCVHHGPGSQNRAGVADFRAHLRGRIAWVAGVNPARGARLLAQFEQIEWATQP